MKPPFLKVWNGSSGQWTNLAQIINSNIGMELNLEALLFYCIATLVNSKDSDEMPIEVPSSNIRGFADLLNRKLSMDILARHECCFRKPKTQDIDSIYNYDLLRNLEVYM